MKTFFFGEHLRLCPWSLALASSLPVLGLESVCPQKGCPWPWPRIFFVSLGLALSLVSSTPPLKLVMNASKSNVQVIPSKLKQSSSNVNFQINYPCSTQLVLAKVQIHKMKTRWFQSIKKGLHLKLEWV